MALKISIIGLTESQLLICCLNKDWNMRQERKQDTHLYIRVWWWLTGDRWRGRSRPDFLHMEFLQSTEGKAKKSNMYNMYVKRQVSINNESYIYIYIYNMYVKRQVSINNECYIYLILELYKKTTVCFDTRII